MIEGGLPDFVALTFTGVVAPAGTPAAIVNKLNAAINESLKAPEWWRRWASSVPRCERDRRRSSGVPRQGAGQVGRRGDPHRHQGGVIDAVSGIDTTCPGERSETRD